MFQRDAAGLPVRMRPSGGREFGSSQCPSTQFGAPPMQLAGDVERKCNGQSAAARPLRIPSSAAVTSPRTAVSIQQRRLAFVRAYPYNGPPRILSLPMTSNIYYQRQPCLTNNSQAFTQCGTAAAGQATVDAAPSRTRSGRGRSRPRLPAVADVQRAARHRRHGPVAYRNDRSAGRACGP